MCFNLVVITGLVSADKPVTPACAKTTYLHFDCRVWSISRFRKQLVSKHFAMNIFDANIDGGEVMFRGAVIGEATAGDDYVKLGIRPEQLARDNKAVLELALQIAEPLYANTSLHGRVPVSKQLVAQSLAGVHSLEAGQGSARFSVNPSYINLSDPANGLRLQA